ncbi:RNA-directed DNA polymerase from mobile element jockey [Trichonephila clavipes]|nr:RNA-directed DNA polymerase from mobile element jockey [Trichonephila clavipes]
MTSSDIGTATAGVAASSPSRLTFDDSFIVENSDLFRETIIARNVYAAWARKFTTAKPNDPDLQNIHMEVAKSGEIVSSHLAKLDVPLFKIPASEKEFDRIILREKNKTIGRKGAKRTVDSDGFAPPKQLVRKVRSPRSTPSSPTPSSAPIDSAPLEEQGEEGMDTINDEPQSQEEVPVATKKPCIPPFFVSPKGDWRQLVALAKLIAPSFQSQMSGRFLKVTVADDVDYRALSKWLESSGVEFKSFMLKQDRPVKVVIRGLPSNTEPEDIKTEI